MGNLKDIVSDTYVLASQVCIGTESSTRPIVVQLETKILSSLLIPPAVTIITLLPFDIPELSTSKESDSKVIITPIYWAVRCPCIPGASKGNAFLMRNSFTKTCPYNINPLKPYFLYSKSGVYMGIHYFSYFCSKHRLWYSLEPPRRGGSNEYPQSMFWAEIRKISAFLSENFQFLEVKFSIYLNRRVYVMS